MRSLMIAAVAALTFTSATTALAADGSGVDRTHHPQSAGMPIQLHPAANVKCRGASRTNGNAARPQLAGDACH